MIKHILLLAAAAGPACHAPWPALLEVAVGNTNVGPNPNLKPVSTAGQGGTARSNNCMSPNLPGELERSPEKKSVEPIG